MSSGLPPAFCSPQSQSPKRSASLGPGNERRRKNKGIFIKKKKEEEIETGGFFEENLTRFAANKVHLEGFLILGGKGPVCPIIAFLAFLPILGLQVKAYDCALRGESWRDLWGKRKRRKKEKEKELTESLSFGSQPRGSPAQSKDLICVLGGAQDQFSYWIERKKERRINEGKKGYSANKILLTTWCHGHAIIMIKPRVNG